MMKGDHHGTATRRGLADLTGLPQAQLFESPNSWLTRAALSQGVSPQELLDFMELGTKRYRRFDPDLLLVSRPGRIALSATRSTSSMTVAERVFTSLRTMGLNGEALLRDDRGRARSRFCPECLREHRVPHFEVHGRFASWRHCPLHNCLMEDRCPHCRAPIVLPFRMSSAGPQKRGVASLSECQMCGGKLHAVQTVPLSRLQMTPADQLRLANGRALMAMLYWGNAKSEDGRWERLRRYRQVVKSMTFWNPQSWYLAHEVRDRVGSEAG